MRSFHKKRPQRKFYFLNHNISASSLRVIAEDGKQVGILSRFDAVNEAQKQEKDLVLIAPKAEPPVAKIIDFKKFLYQEEKKQQEARKGIKKSVVKDIKLSLFIAKADLDRLEHKALDFISEGHQVRLNLTLKGREMFKRNMAFDLMNKFIASLGEINISKPPRLMGRILSAVVARKK